MKPTELVKAFAPVPKAFHDGVMAAAQSVREEYMPRRLRVAVAIAVSLALVAGTTLALVNYGVLDFRSYGPPTQEFISNITPIGELYENEALTLTVTDAIFDGQSMAIAMNLFPKDSKMPVYIEPKLTATAGGKELDLSMFTIRGGADHGFLYPCLNGKNAADSDYGIEAFLAEEAPAEEVTWTLRLLILKPNWPLSPAPDFSLAMDDDFKAFFAKIDNAYQDAFANREILVEHDDSLDNFANISKEPAGIPREKWDQYTIGQKLARLPAFTLVDTVECQIVLKTPKGMKTGIGKGLTVPFDDYTVVFGGFDQTFLHTQYAFDIVFRQTASEELIDTYLSSLTYQAQLPDGKTLGPVYFSSSSTTAYGDGQTIWSEQNKFAPETDLPESIVFMAFWNGEVRPDLAFMVPIE